MKLIQVILSCVLLAALSSIAEETVLEKGETMKNKAVDGVKKTYRKGKDEVCEMINGKMECAVKKGINKAKSAADAVGTKATEIKNKAD
ncbi:MAG: hypothetical protein JNL11_10495 [Bdellovibrionaceae bacterium]|nr:hypothetical protein [Pseudobdellovibrionaceae bacterium]